MGSNPFPFFPEQASAAARGVDTLFLFLFAVSVFFAGLIFVLTFYFAVRYRRRSDDERPKAIHGSLALELLWSLVPLAITLVMFGWGAWIYMRNARPPANAMEIYVVAKQWMWKIQHPEGSREINELHIPLGVPVKLIMTSEDVIHSFYVPAFRVKMDVLPGRYTSEWFLPVKTGKYHLFCAEYCGTDHSAMGGWVYVLEPPDYEKWLSGGLAGGSMAESGEQLFQKLACNTCHRNDGSGRGPNLEGLFNKTVLLESGTTLVADEGYLRESILNPQAKVVAGYRPVMPTFQGQVSEESVVQLIAYIKSLGKSPAK